MATRGRKEQWAEDIQGECSSRAEEERILVPRPFVARAKVRFRITLPQVSEGDGLPSGHRKLERAPELSIAIAVGMKLWVSQQQAAAEQAAEEAERVVWEAAVQPVGRWLPSSWDSRYKTAAPRLRTSGRSN